MSNTLELRSCDQLPSSANHMRSHVAWAGMQHLLRLCYIEVSIDLITVHRRGCLNGGRVDVSSTYLIADRLSPTRALPVPFCLCNFLLLP